MNPDECGSHRDERLRAWVYGCGLTVTYTEMLQMTADALTERHAEWHVNRELVLAEETGK